MKKLMVIGLLVCCISCTKSVTEQNNSDLVKTTTSVLQSKYLIKDLGNTVLTITMEPVVTCYSYANGQTPKPCDIFVSATCTLSNPVNTSIKVVIEKTNIAEEDKNTSNNVTTTTMVVNLAPNTTSLTFKSIFPNLNNQNIPDAQYRIISATEYTMVN
jgi:hypothetical protein